jgi:nitrite reductase (NADH) small subunit
MAASPTRTRQRQRVAFPAAELPRNGRRLVVAGRREIAVFDVEGTLYALKNRCPHQQAPLLPGMVGGTRVASPVGSYCMGMAGRVLRCPWHAYEFDMETGINLVEPERYRVAVYEVRREDKEIAVYV